MSALRNSVLLGSNAFLRQVLWSASLIDLPLICNFLETRGVLQDEGTRKRFAEHLPGRTSGWEAAEALGDDVASAYWSSVSIHVRDDSEPRGCRICNSKAARRKSASLCVLCCCIYSRHSDVTGRGLAWPNSMFCQNAGGIIAKFR